MEIKEKEAQVLLIMPMLGLLIAIYNVTGYWNSGGVGEIDRGKEKKLFWVGISLIVVPLIIFFTAKAPKE